MNAVEIEEAVSRLAGEPFDPEEFPFAFLEAFGNKQTTLKRLKSNSSNQSDLAGGVLQRNNIHLKVCADGEVTATLTALRESPATGRQKAKFILATDGKTLEAENLVDGEIVICDFPDFHDHFGFFLALAGITTVKQIRENAFDIKATGRLNRLYIELLKDNPGWDKADRREELNHFMARLIFCFFAEDTNIFHSDGLFTATVQQMSDASNTHEVLSEMFRAMSTTPQKREEAQIRNWAEVFPYVNGGLFSGGVEVPRFSKIARSYLLHVGNLDWKKINPDIFGSMIQAVADEEEERGALGMHYTRGIISNSAFGLLNPNAYELSILSSRLHLVWIATVCGKLETRYRYSNTLGWNTFPVPTLTDQNKTDLTRCAEDILLAREAHFPATIADLYAPEAMPENLRQAHDRNDEVLERIYIGRRFKNDTDRLEKLFELYTKMTTQQASAQKSAKGKTKGARK